MSNKVLKLVDSIGNVFCIYRNYYSYSPLGRCLIWIRISLEFTVVIACVIAYLTLHHSNIPVIIYCLNVSSNLIIILLAWYHSKKFIKFLQYSGKIDDYFAKDLEYKKCLQKKCKAVVLSLVVLSMLAAAIIAHAVIRHNDHTNSYMYVLTATVSAICLVRYVIEYVVIACALSVLADQVQCIIRRVPRERLRTELCEYSTRSNAEEQHVPASFDELATVYINIKESSLLVNSIFGVEITLVLIWLIFYFIVILYGLTLCLIKENCYVTTYLIKLMKFTVYLSALYGLSRSAQSALNSTNDLRCCLGRILILSSTNVQLFKETKQFLRLVSSRPISTSALGSVQVNMALLPQFVMFFTSYTVIALQFNNIL